MILIDVFSVGRIQTRMGEYHKKAPAITGALNRAVENARTNVVKQTKEDYHVKPAEIRSTIRLEKSTPSNLKVIVRSRDTRRELIAF